MKSLQSPTAVMSSKGMQHSLEDLQSDCQNIPQQTLCGNTIFIGLTKEQL